MSDNILQTLRSGILEIFPDLENLQITAETRLGDIPDYDSMSAINLQTFIEEKFPLKISLDMLGEDMTVGELSKYIGGYVK